MDPARWRRIEQLYHDALARPPEEREALLAEACAGDEALRQEVEALLATPPTAEGIFAAPAFAAPALAMAAPRRDDVGRVLSDPPVLTGQRIGVYHLRERIGIGGMGEVYRAHGTRLGRDVAIKVLPAAFTSDPNRLARFEREARLLAALNHPHIAAIHSVEDSHGVHALVLELVEGPTLADRIGKGALALTDALDIARQIAEALEVAHEHGIVHRDLKPANIKLTRDGIVKVLDFGLAKAFVGDAGGADLSQVPTVTVNRTQAGVLAGTPAYMSPEQARGQAVDKRTDIWAFGCVLYEMLTARPAFPGATISDTIAAILDREPDWPALLPKTPAAVRRLLQRCLEKDAKRRWHAAADVRIEIEAILADPRGLTVHPETVAARQPVWRRAIPYAATALAAAAIATAVDWSARQEPTAAITRFSIVLPDGQRLTRPGSHNIAVSPDSQNIVYVADNQLYLRAMGDIEARPIPGTHQDVNTPFFSPDGQWIGFYAVPEGRLKKIAIAGGASVTIADLAIPFGARWEADDRILVGQGPRGIVRVSANGGTPETIVKAEAGETMHGPQMLPDGEHILFTVTKGTGAARWDQAQIVVQSLRSGERTVLINGGSDARYVPTGHIVHALGANLLAVPFDERSLTVTGGPVPIREGIGRSAQPTNFTGAMFLSFSPSGTLVYFMADALQTARSLALVDRKGESVALPMPPLQYDDPRISPDGTQLAVRVNTENESNIWIYDLSGVLAPRRLTFGGTNTSPAWAPDGRRIAFISNRDNNRNAIFWQAADGSGPAERLTDPKAAQPLSLRFSPDGKIVYRDAHGDGSIWILPLDGDRKPQLVIDSLGNQFDPSFSPDGRWIAYGSDESGRFALYVQPYPPTGAKYQITTANSLDPLWSPDGRQIFYLEVLPGTLGLSRPLMSVDVRTESGITYANPTRVFDSMLVSGNWPYDVTPDGSRFVVLLGTGDADRETAPNPEIRVTLNWFEELRQRVPRGSR